MKCEICKTIESLGLDAKAHDLWICADAPSGNVALQRTRSYLNRVVRQISVFVILKARQRRVLAFAHHRAPLVTLGL